MQSITFQAINNILVLQIQSLCQRQIRTIQPENEVTEVQAVVHTRLASVPVTATMRRMPLAMASSVTMTTEPISLLRFKCLQ